jgi:hypothetical protein
MHCSKEKLSQASLCVVWQRPHEPEALNQPQRASEKNYYVCARKKPSSGSGEKFLNCFVFVRGSRKKLSSNCVFMCSHVHTRNSLDFVVVGRPLT